MNYWDKTKFFEKLLMFTWLAFLFSCLLFLSFTSHAAGEQDYFPMHQNGNSLFTETLMNALDSNLDSENNFVFVKYGFQDGAFTNFYYVSIPKNSENYIYAEKYNNLYQFSLYFDNPNGVRAYRINFLSDGTRGGIYEASLTEFQGCYSSNYSNSVSYISNFQLYTGSNTSTRKIVLLYGDAEEEETLGENDTIPEDTPKPNLEDYLPADTTPPTFDNSSVESALGSIFDYLQYQTNKISGTISGIGEYLSDSIMWGLQMVINNIRSKIEEMTNAIGDKIDEVITGIGSKIEDIQDSIDYITQPVDGDIIYDSISTTSLVSNFNTIKSSITTFQTSFDNLSEPTEYKIPIHLENLNYPIFGTLTVQYIDLSVINPVKSIIRLMITALVTYSLVITIFDSISNYINGGGDE